MIGADWVKRSSILFSKRVVVNDSIVKMLRGDHGSEVEVNISEEEISRLMDLGFSRELCLDAIKRSKGNLEAACDLLLGE